MQILGQVSKSGIRSSVAAKQLTSRWGLAFTRLMSSTEGKVEGDALTVEVCSEITSRKLPRICCFTWVSTFILIIFLNLRSGVLILFPFSL